MISLVRLRRKTPPYIDEVDVDDRRIAARQQIPIRVRPTEPGRGDIAERRAARMRESTRRVFEEVSRPNRNLVHPAQIPRIGIERADCSFGTKPVAFAISDALIVAVIPWATIAPQSFSTLGNLAQGWVISRFK
jgi:hypothetical protein